MNISSDGYPIGQANSSIAQGAIDTVSGSSSEAAIPVPRVVVVCSSCKAILSVRRAYIGTAIQCKLCDHIFTIPIGADSPPTPVAEASEREALSALVARLREENRDLAERLEQSGDLLKVARKERQEQSEQLATLRDELASVRGDIHRMSEEREALTLLRVELQDQNEELARALASRGLEHEATLSAERAARQQLTLEVQSLQANAEETAKVAEQLISASLHSADGPSRAEFELGEVRLQAEELKSKLDEATCLYRLMSETLGGFGIQIAPLLPEAQTLDCAPGPSTIGHGQSQLGANGDRREPCSRP
jgi:hypothetical protein